MLLGIPAGLTVGLVGYFQNTGTSRTIFLVIAAFMVGYSAVVSAVIAISSRRR